MPEGRSRENDFLEVLKSLDFEDRTSSQYIFVHFVHFEDAVSKWTKWTRATGTILQMSNRSSACAENRILKIGPLPGGAGACLRRGVDLIKRVRGHEPNQVAQPVPEIGHVRAVSTRCA